MASFLIKNGAKIQGIENALFSSAIRYFQDGSEGGVRLLFDSGFQSSMIRSETVEHVLTQKWMKSFEFISQSGFDLNTIRSSALTSLINDNFQQGIEALLKSGYDLKGLRGIGTQILFEAIRNQKVKSSIIQLLISNGISCDYCVEHGDRYWVDIGYGCYSLLSASVERGEKDLVQMLLEHGIKANCEYPLHIEFNMSYWGKVKVSSEDFNPLFVAIRKHRNDIAELLIQHGANPYMKDFYARDYMPPYFEKWNKKVCFFNGEVRTHMRIEQGFDFTVALANGFNEGFGDTNIGSLLIQAIQSKNTQLVKLLLDAGHPVNFTAQNGKMPIKMAVEGGNREIVALLLNHGAEWDDV